MYFYGKQKKKDSVMTAKIFIVACILVLMLFVPSEIVALVTEPNLCIFKDPRNSSLLTFEKINEGLEICCRQSGKHPKKDKENHILGCCGNGTYKTEMEVCCANKVFDSPITSGQNAGLRQICCKEELHLEESKHYCCGNQYIKADRECCHGKPYNDSTHYCAADMYITPRGFENCGEVQYNTSRQKCCGNLKLHSVPESQGECCGMKLINSSTHQCCKRSDKNIPQPRTGLCCGTEVYNPSTELCCGWHKFPSYGVRDCCGIYNYYNKSNPREACCSNGDRSRPFNTDKEICCNGEVHTIQNTTSPACCGKQVYSSKDKICCNNTLTPKTAPGHHTCGGQITTKGPSLCGKLPYAPEKDLCCNSEIHIDAKKHGKKCCESTTQAYFPGNESCYFGQVQHSSSKYPGGLRTSTQRVTSTMTTEAPQPSGVCEICSPEWKPRNVYQSVNSKAIDICTKKAIIIEVDQIITPSTEQTFPWTQLTIIYKVNLYTSSHNNHLLRGKTFQLLLPCSCVKLQKMKKKKYLLLTNIKFQKREIFLGDGDQILPLKRKLRRLIEKNSKNCPHNIVNNIKSLLQRPFIRR